jgi:hypothetical protein
MKKCIVLNHLINFLFILLNSSVCVDGQKINRWQLSLQLQPELTYYKNNYAFRWEKKYTKSTFNVGLASSLHFNLTDGLFVEGGLGFISRKLNTKVFVDQSLLPRPYYDSTGILYITKSVSFRTLQIPFSIGYNIIMKKNAFFFAKGTYIPNFLIDAKYEVNNYPGFKKNYWQGHSINAGVGLDYQLNKKIVLTNTISYSITNTVTKDDYTFSQDDRRIALTHTYLQLSTGIKINFRQH